MKKLVSLLLAVLLIVAALPVFAQADEDNPYAWMAGTKLTYWYPMWQGEADWVGTGTMGDLPFYQALYEKTGVEIEWIHPSVADNTTGYYLMLASANLPDIVTHEYYVYYQGGGDAAIADDVYIDLKPLLPEYAPEYWNMLDEDTLRQVTTDEGHIWCFYMIDTFAQPSYTGPIWRADWLRQLGLEIPHTMSEYKAALVAMKEQLGVEHPVLLPASGVSGVGSLVGAYGTKNDFILLDDKVYYGPTLDGYREYLREMNAWYNEGLIPADFAAYDGSTLNADVTEGVYGLLVDQGFWSLQTWTNMMEGKDDDFLVGGPYAILDDDEDGKIDFQLDTYRAQQNCTAVTTDCKNPEVAVAWLGAKFTPEFIILANYGVEGVTFEYEDGKPVYTEFALHNPDGIGLGTLLYKYGLGKGPYNRIMDRNWPYQYSDTAIGAQYTWEESSTGTGEIPEVFMSMTPEDSAEYAAITGDIKTYVAENTTKFITGELSVDDDWDNFVSTIMSMDVERAIELLQASYDNYLAR